MIDDIWRDYAAGNFDASFRCNTLAIEQTGGIDLLHLAGLALLQMDRRDDAVQLLNAVMAFRPQSPHYYQHAAFISQQKGLADLVDRFADAGLRDFPHDAMLHALKADTLRQRGQIDQAIAYYERWVFTDPSEIMAKINLALCYSTVGNFALADLYFDAAARQNPQHRDLLLGRAAMYGRIRRIDEAIALLEPMQHDADARFMLALFYLDRGDYARGWSLHRDRWDAVSFGMAARPPRPCSDLGQIVGQRVAVIREGGFGDLFLMLRYLPMLADVAGEVLLHAGPADLRLLQETVPPNVTLLDFNPQANSVSLPDDCAWTIALLDLPYYFQTSIDTIPTPIPYIKPPEASTRVGRLPPTEKRRVGLAWAGAPAQGVFNRGYDARRSIALSELAGLAEIDGIELISLQVGDRAEDGGSSLISPLPKDANWAETASLIAQLDLVISVDTAVAHLAAAMGKPVWLLSRFDACWRWRCNGQDSDHWYPGVRIFSQHAFGDWSVAIAAMLEAIRLL